MIAAMLASAALSARAEIVSPTVTHDPLMNQIMSRQLTLPAGGVTGSTRLGSGEAITLNMIDPLAPLMPAEGLVEKPVKPKAAAKGASKVRRTVDQLKKMSRDERRADWSGLK